MKILTILLCMFLLVGTVSAYTDTGIDYRDTIHGGIPTMGEVDFTPNHPNNGGAIDWRTLTIPMPTDSTNIRAWQYEDIEIE